MTTGTHEILISFTWRDRLGEPVPWLATLNALHYQQWDTGDWYRFWHVGDGEHITDVAIDDDYRLLVDIATPQGPRVLRFDGLTVQEV